MEQTISISDEVEIVLFAPDDFRCETVFNNDTSMVKAIEITFLCMTCVTISSNKEFTKPDENQRLLVGRLHEDILCEPHSFDVQFYEDESLLASVTFRTPYGAEF